MKIEKIKSTILNDEYIKVVHPSGLTIYLYPKKGYKATYAIFATNYGSINTKFKIKGETEITTVPDGIAHYLEHKLFESEDGDAFSLYSKTGASANAYTSFDLTGYLFSCSENFLDSLNILLNFVQNPYFTDETVKKEQGIIGQEIRMYDDDPNWRVMFNLLKAMYHNHPVNVDIAGTVESIAKITPESLYKCYNTFYNPSNMALCISGNFNIDEVMKLIEKTIKNNNKKVEFENIFPKEPLNVVNKRVVQEFEISSPMFELGFKEDPKDKRASTTELAYTSIILEAIASKSSKLYKKLLDEKLINTSSFSYEYFEGPGYRSIIFSGESADPDKTAQIIKNYIDEIHKNGISEEDFCFAKKSLYGKIIELFDSIDAISNLMVNFSFANRDIFEYIDVISNADIKSLHERLKDELITSNSSLSIVKPIAKEKSK